MAERVVETQVIEVKTRGVKGAEQEVRRLADAERRAKDELEALRAVDRKSVADAKAHEAALRAQRVEVQKLSRESRSARGSLNDMRQAERAAAAEARAAASAARAAGQERARAAREEAKAVEGLARAERDLARAREAAARQDREAYSRGLSQQTARIGQNIAGRREAIAAANARLRELGADPDNVRARRSARLGMAQGFAGGLGSAGLGLLGAVGGTAVGAAGLGLREVVQRGQAFGGQRAALEAALGSRGAADRRIAEIRATGAGLEGGLATANRLGGLGLDSSARSVRSVAAIAAGSPGKTTSDFAEALADAVTGENERLKEFGIRASKDGDKVRYTFRGITTEVQNNAQAIQEYFNKLGESPQFSGALERQVNSLQGALGTVSDEITLLASEVYDSGVGEALGEIVNEIASMVRQVQGGGAKAIGKTLGDALRSAWKEAKELIGPVKELPERLRGVIETAGSFASTLIKIAGAAKDVTEAVGPTNVALASLALKLIGVNGPLGLVAAGGLALGTAFAAAGKYAVDLAYEIGGLDSAITKFERKQEELQKKHDHDVATGQLRDQIAATKEQNRRAGDIETAATAAGGRFRAARLREMGESEATLTDSQRKTLDAEERRVVNEVRRSAGGIGAATSGSANLREGSEAARAGDQFAAAAERRADSAELGRLMKKKGTKGARLTKSEQKRLGELETKYDLPSTQGYKKPGKPDLSAFGEDVEGEIKRMSEDAGRVAGLRAIRSGLGEREADRIAKRTEKESAERLRQQVGQGKFLPGQINASTLAIAGVEDVAGRGTPPVITVNNFSTKVDVGGITVDRPQVAVGPDELGVELGRVVRRTLEVEVRDALRTVTRSIAL